MDDLKQYIREVPDFPKPGILFYDITTLLQDPLALRMTVDRFVWLLRGASRSTRWWASSRAASCSGRSWPTT